jgi:23S rRNA (cytosine1962-C5)-methyltransferase
MQALPDTTHRRLIYGESDGLPGLVVDQYADVLTWSCLSFGMEQRRDVIIDELRQIVHPRMIVERNDSALRTKDGLEPSKGILWGEGAPTALIEENGVFYAVDALEGPKTGFFIDQRLNRSMTSRFASGRKVLDAFCGDGGFGLQAASSGAESVSLIDTSETAIARAQANAERNGLASTVAFERADSLDRLGSLVQEGTRFDMVVLDPPAFAKSRRNIEEATRAYQRININGLQLLDAGGILATGSCSQAIDDTAFLKVIRYASRKADRPLRVLLRGAVSPDHPALFAMAETDYLKFYVFQVIGDESPAWLE